MKPWFEREAKVIKFPEPEKKVVQMPNVASYPDFITGVADLKARRHKGEISQDSHDKLYTDLIHRFMRKEDVENPWFLREAPEDDQIKNRVMTALNKKQAEDPIFDKVYKNYDLMNDLMSFGIHRLWKKNLITWMNPQMGNKIIDVAAGTGDLAKMISKKTLCFKSKRSGTLS